MNHAGEGLLQAYMDGELEAEERSSVAAHVGTCAVCKAELDALRSAALSVHGAFAMLDAAPSMQDESMARVRAAVAAARAREASPARTAAPADEAAARTSAPIEFPQRRDHARSDDRRFVFITGSLARAAALVLLLAGGAAAMIPGSPIRRWLEQGIDRIATVFSPRIETAPIVTPPAERPVTPAFVPGAEMSVAAVDGSVRVVIGAAGSGTVLVKFADDADPTVRTDSSAHGASFRTGAGRLEVMNLGASHAQVILPNALRAATIEVNGRTYLQKDEDGVQVTGPVLRRDRDGILFRTGS